MKDSNIKEKAAMVAGGVLLIGLGIAIQKYRESIAFVSKKVALKLPLVNRLVHEEEVLDSPSSTASDSFETISLATPNDTPRNVHHYTSGTSYNSYYDEEWRGAQTEEHRLNVSLNDSVYIPK